MMVTEDQDASRSPARAQFGCGRQPLPPNRQSNRGASKLESTLSSAESSLNNFLIVTFCHPVFLAGRAALHNEKGPGLLPGLLFLRQATACDQSWARRTMCMDSAGRGFSMETGTLIS